MYYYPREGYWSSGFQRARCSRTAKILVVFDIAFWLCSQTETKVETQVLESDRIFSTYILFSKCVEFSSSLQMTQLVLSLSGILVEQTVHLAIFNRLVIRPFCCWTTEFQFRISGQCGFSKIYRTISSSSNPKWNVKRTALCLLASGNGFLTRKFAWPLRNL